MGLSARLAAGRLRHEDVGAQRRLGRQGASVQVSNEDRRGHSEMMSDTFFEIFTPSPYLKFMQPPLLQPKFGCPSPDVICAWPHTPEKEGSTQLGLLPSIKAGHLFAPGPCADDVMCCEITLLIAILLCYDILRKFVNHMRDCALAEKLLMLPGK